MEDGELLDWMAQLAAVRAAVPDAGRLFLEACPVCLGTGATAWRPSSTCARCAGTGQVERWKGPLPGGWLKLNR